VKEELDILFIFLSLSIYTLYIYIEQNVTEYEVKRLYVVFSKNSHKIIDPRIFSF